MTARLGKCGGRAGRLARHTPCDRPSTLSAVAQTLRARRGYSAESGPAVARCSSRPGRIWEPRLVTARPTRPLRALRTLPGASFFSSLRLPLCKGGSTTLPSSLTTQGTTSTRWWPPAQECAPPFGLPSPPANSAGESGGVAAAAVDRDSVAAGPAKVRVGGAGPARP